MSRDEARNLKRFIVNPALVGAGHAYSEGRERKDCVMRTLNFALLVAALASSLAGCQSVQELAADAEYRCEAAGLRPGTRRFERCAHVNYTQNRAQSDQATAAVATAAAAGVIGGAVIGAAAATPRYGYYYGPYYRPYYYW